MKSALVAYRVAWEITKNPALRVLYISSTSGLAVKQLKFIKDILTSDIYRRYWPEMVNQDEFHREKWTETEIAVDHPIRKKENIRDSTVFTGGLTTSLTGLHCDIAVLDDVVVQENAYTEEGRGKVKRQYSLLASIEGTDSREWAVGTRYFGADLYADQLEMQVEVVDEEGQVLESESLYEVFERVVEDSPGRDGSGQFLWPRQQRSDGKWFGFNAKELARKRAQYLDKTQFYAQYYNDPNDPSAAGITADMFQYYKREELRQANGYWYIADRRLNLCASIDFAFSRSKKADYTCLVVVGIDGDRNVYVLDIERFKTDKISDYFAAILRLHQRWGFQKLLAEVTTAQDVIVKDLKNNYIYKYNLALSVVDHNPTRHQGSKEERTDSILQHRYNDRKIWHYRGGHCQLLEEELILKFPSHDDIKDALAVAVDAVVVPTMHGLGAPKNDRFANFSLKNVVHPRFGGIN
jgi:hypothetical protein